MHKLMSILLVLFIFTSIASSFIIPGYAKDVAKKKKQLFLLEREGKNLPILNNLLTTKNEEISMLEETFPAKENLVSVVQNIDTLAARVGVIASLHFESEEPQADSQGGYFLPVSITVNGNFADCYAFLSGLENNQYLYILDEVLGKTVVGLRGENSLVARGKLYVAKN